MDEYFDKAIPSPRLAAAILVITALPDKDYEEFANWFQRNRAWRDQHRPLAQPMDVIDKQSLGGTK